MAEFIAERDGTDCNWENVYLLNGASDGIRTLLYMCMAEGRKAGVMIPIPQYPLYTATLAELDAYPVSQ